MRERHDGRQDGRDDDGRDDRQDARGEDGMPMWGTPPPEDRPGPTDGPGSGPGEPGAAPLLRLVPARRGGADGTGQDDPPDGSGDGGGPGGPVVSGHVVDHPGGSAVVARTGGTASGGGVGVVELRDVVPAWARSREAFTGLVAERSRRAALVTLFHGMRLPRYWWRLSLRSPRALGRAGRRVWDWTFDAKAGAVRSALAQAPSLGGQEGVAFWRITDQHRRSKALRFGFVAVVLAVVAPFAVWGWLAVPRWGLWAAVAVLAPVLGAFGRTERAAPVVDSIRYVGNVVPPLRPELIEAALTALGISQLSRGLREQGLQLVNPIHRDGPGYRVDIDLPAVPAGAVIEKREQLAAGVRRPRSVVWPQADTDVHEARLVLWVGDKAPNKAKPRPWALTGKGKVDLFEAFPVGVNPQGRAVTLCLMFASMIIGAIPRMGKTFALRVILLAAALDVRAELHVFDLKGGADLRPLGPVSHRFRIGDEPDDIAYLAADTADLRAEMSRRYKVVRSLPERICPEGKVTPALAERKDLGLHPIVLAIDETHYAFEHPEYGKQIEADVTDLVKRGPAVGIIVILATQRPDAKSIPPGISTSAVLRFALKVMKHDVNDMILGSGAYTSGIRATMFARSDLGTGYLVGEGDDPQIVTFGYVDAVTAKAVAARARAT